MSYAYAEFDVNTFGSGTSKNTYSTWGLMLESVSIPMPEPQTNYIQIPGRDGALDLSEALTGSVNFNDRPVTMQFSILNTYDNWAALLTTIASYLHGKKYKMRLDIDLTFYYYGRFTVDSSKSDEATSTIVITGIVEPYKYEVAITSVTHNIAGSGVVNHVGLRMPTPVSITTPGAGWTVVFNGVTYTLASGLNVIPQIILVEGNNGMTFFGTGFPIVSYRRGTF